MIAPDWYIFFIFGAGLELVVAVFIGSFCARYFQMLELMRSPFAET